MRHPKKNCTEGKEESQPHSLSLTHKEGEGEGGEEGERYL
jgi:hypothetical protein